MDNVIQIIAIIGNSYPIAFIVVGVTVGIVVRRSMYQMMHNERLEKLDRLHGNNAVVVQSRQRGEFHDNAG